MQGRLTNARPPARLPCRLDPGRAAQGMVRIAGDAGGPTCSHELERGLRSRFSETAGQRARADLAASSRVEEWVEPLRLPLNLGASLGMRKQRPPPAAVEPPEAFVSIAGEHLPRRLDQQESGPTRRVVPQLLVAPPHRELQGELSTRVDHDLNAHSLEPPRQSLDPPVALVRVGAPARGDMGCGHDLADALGTKRNTQID